MNSHTIRYNDNISYSPAIIKKWCQCVCRDPYFNPEDKELVEDLLFRYFLNNSIPLNKNGFYFIKKSKNTNSLVLYRDQTEENNKIEYIIRMNGKTVTRLLSKDEWSLICHLMIDWNAECQIKEKKERGEYYESK